MTSILICATKGKRFENFDGLAAYMGTDKHPPRNAIAVLVNTRSGGTVKYRIIWGLIRAWG